MNTCNKLIITRKNDLVEGQFHLYMFNWYYDDILIENDIKKIHSVFGYDLNLIISEKETSLNIQNLIVENNT